MSFKVGPTCDGCGICVAACPRGAIRPGPPGGTPFEVVSLDCNDCGKCAIVCPHDALAVDPAWAQCFGRGCPLVSKRLEGWACTEGWARCGRCGGALWKAPGDSEWVCARCDTASRVICPKIRRAAATAAAPTTEPGAAHPSVDGAVRVPTRVNGNAPTRAEVPGAAPSPGRPAAR